ncbi:MAG: hypothetical protein Q8K88_09840, partial [Bradyrhizobium sp.]|nr:hypothetical protein [Bradyrhizobium sp.]
VFLAFFPAFFTTRLARFFTAAALLARTREALRAFFVFGFLEAFFLGVATTISFIAQTGLPGGDRARDAYRVASASIPNTEKTSGFRSRL